MRRNKRRILLSTLVVSLSLLFSIIGLIILKKDISIVSNHSTKQDISFSTAGIATTSSRGVTIETGETTTNSVKIYITVDSTNLDNGLAAFSAKLNIGVATASNHGIIYSATTQPELSVESENWSITESDFSRWTGDTYLSFLVEINEENLNNVSKEESVKIVITLPTVDILPSESYSQDITLTDITETDCYNNVIKEENITYNINIENSVESGSVTIQRGNIGLNSIELYAIVDSTNLDNGLAGCSARLNIGEATASNHGMIYSETKQPELSVETENWSITESNFSGWGNDTYLDFIVEIEKENLNNIEIDSEVKIKIILPITNPTNNEYSQDICLNNIKETDYLNNIASVKDVEYTITVKPVTDMEVAPESNTIKVGENYNLLPTILPINADIYSKTYKSNNTGIATVSNTGSVTGISKGTTTVSTTVTDCLGNTITKTNTVNVINDVVSVEGISLNRQSLTLNTTSNKQFTLVATITPQDATNKDVIWSSSDETVATVQNGIVTAVKRGTAIITATTQDGRKTATCRVEVKNQITDVILKYGGNEITSDGIKIIEGGSVKIDVSINPSDEGTSITWKSSNESIATVDSNGNIKAIKKGETTITVTVTDETGNVITKTFKVKIDTGIDFGNKYNIYIDGDTVYIRNVRPGTTILDFISETTLDSSYSWKTYTLKDGKDVEVTDNNRKIATGMKLKIYKDGYEQKDYIFIVRGDLNGDGYMDGNDGIRMTLMMANYEKYIYDNWNKIYQYAEYDLARSQEHNSNLMVMINVFSGKTWDDVDQILDTNKQ